MKITAIIGFKYCGLGFVFASVMQFVKIQISATNIDLIISCLQIASFAAIFVLAVIIVIKEVILMRVEINHLKADIKADAKRKAKELNEN